MCCDIKGYYGATPGAAYDCLLAGCGTFCDGYYGPLAGCSNGILVAEYYGTSISLLPADGFNGLSGNGFTAYGSVYETLVGGVIALALRGMFFIYIYDFVPCANYKL